MWILFAAGSAFFAGITAILAKIGTKDVNSHLATAIRTFVVLLFAWFMVFLVGSQSTLDEIPPKTLLFLILSGLSTGLSWICYFKALSIGEVGRVAPIDKSGTILTMILAFLLLGEPITIGMLVGMLFIGGGTYLMIERKEVTNPKPDGWKWMAYALASAIFASMTSILGKIGIEGVESNLGTAIRTVVVLLMAWAIVFWQHRQREIPSIRPAAWAALLFSGLATGLSWLCYYRALQEGPASIVVPIDKLSILVTVLLARLILGEQITRKNAIGLISLTLGTLLLLLPW